MFKTKLVYLLLILLFTGHAQARVYVCHRKAQIFFGVFQHQWLRTDHAEAGMGPVNLGPDEKLGASRSDLPLVTKVYVVDHRNDQADECFEVREVDEDCVDGELVIGRYLGQFGLVNCQYFVGHVLHKCFKQD